MKYILLLWIGFFGFSVATQANGWQTIPFSDKCFVENKGQWPEVLDPRIGKTLFAADLGSTIVYFGTQGIGFEYSLWVPAAKDGPKEDEYKSFRSTQWLAMTWPGADPDTRVLGGSEVSQKFHFETPDGTIEAPIYGARGFKELIYHEIFPGITLRYEFHPSSGLKYTLVVAPGADPAGFKMKWHSTDVPLLNKDGDLNIPFAGDWIGDQAPISWQNINDKQKKVKASFEISAEGLISFKMGKYHKDLELIIDPWTIVPASLTANLKAYDIHKDKNGNVYVFGGSNNAKVQKYDPTGAPLWTYTTLAGCAINCGGMIADPNGNVYITDVGRIIKLDNQGAVKWTAFNLGICEIWTLTFNCDYTRLAVGTGCGSGSIVYVKTSDGARLGNLKQIDGQEIRSITTSPDGNFYCMSFLVSNLTAVDPNMNVLFATPDGYVLDYLGPNYTPWSQQNALAVNKQFIYTTDGAVLHKRNKNTGALVKTVVIPGGATELNSGIAVDTCGFVYAGSQSGVYKFDADLLPAGAPAVTPGPVYDVNIGMNGEVLACGAGFVASLGGLSSCVADTLSCCPDLNIGVVTTQTNCNGNTGTATANPTNGIPPFTYSWSTTPPQTTQTASGLAAGTYTCMVKDWAGCTKTVSATITNNTGLSNSIVSQSDALCFGDSSGKATALATGGIPGYTYSWNTNPVQTGPTATGLAAGTYTCTAQDASGCKSSVNVTIGQPFRLAATIFSHTNVKCFGGSDGTAVVSLGGGKAPFVFSWNTSPPNNNPNPNNLRAGTWVLTVTDSNNCVAKDTVLIQQPDSIGVLAQIQAPLCFGDKNAWAQVAVQGGQAPYTYSWNTSPPQNGPKAEHLASGKYLVTVKDSNKCQKIVEVVIQDPDPLNLALVPTGITCKDGKDGKIQALAIGGSPPYTYQWGSGGFEQKDIRSGLAPGDYQVIVKDANGCRDTGKTMVPDATSGEACYVFQIPDAFTPNGDGENDVFKPVARGITHFNLQIFNRWGERIYATDDVTLGWDGRTMLKGSGTAKDGLYLYAIQVNDESGKPVQYHGTITLIR